MSFLMNEILDFFDLIVALFVDFSVTELDFFYQLHYYVKQFIALMFEIFLFMIVLFLQLMK